MLPKDWQRVVVGECADLLTGYAFGSQDYVEPSKSAVKLLRGDNIVPGFLRWVDAKYWAAPYAEQLKRYEMHMGDIVIAMDRPIVSAGLKCSVVQQHDLPSLLVQRVARLRAKQNLSQEYLAQVLQTRQFIEHLKEQKTETAVPHISPHDIREFEFPCPLKPDEQRRIAEILSTWDQAIATTERLLENSRSQKLRLSHQILTGKVRLRDFAGNGSKRATPYGSLPIEWDYCRIGAVAAEVSQKLGNAAPHPVLSCTKHKGLVDSLVYFSKQVFSANTSTYKVAPRGCFVYATNHIDEGSIGYQDLYDFGLVSPMYTVFKTDNNVDDTYLYALLKTEHYRQIFASATNASVDRRGSLRWKDFQNLHVPLPPIKEQRAIANVLAMADRKADLIQAQLNLLRDEKAALMFQLLTGKRRVKLPETEAKTGLQE